MCLILLFVVWAIYGIPCNDGDDSPPKQCIITTCGGCKCCGTTNSKPCRIAQAQVHIFLLAPNADLFVIVIPLFHRACLMFEYIHISPSPLCLSRSVCVPLNGSNKVLICGLIIKIGTHNMVLTNMIIGRIPGKKLAYTSLLKKETCTNPPAIFS